MTALPKTGDACRTIVIMATKLVLSSADKLFRCSAHSHRAVSFCVPCLLHFEHFLVVLEPVTVSVSTAVAASCCKISCSETAQTFVNKFVSKLLSNL